MNAVDHDFTVTVFETSDRAEMWKRIFGTLTVPVESPICDWVFLPNFDEPEMVYKLKMSAISDEEYEKLVDEIANKFDAPRSEVQLSFEIQGLPIRANECTLTIHHPHKWV